jgi:hypothetical protein
MERMITLWWALVLNMISNTRVPTGFTKDLSIKPFLFSKLGHGPWIWHPLIMMLTKCLLNSQFGGKFWDWADMSKLKIQIYSEG